MRNIIWDRDARIKVVSLIINKLDEKHVAEAATLLEIIKPGEKYWLYSELRKTLFNLLTENITEEISYDI
jgi:hypothetical protein